MNRNEILNANDIEIKLQNMEIENKALKNLLSDSKKEESGTSKKLKDLQTKNTNLTNRFEDLKNRYNTLNENNDNNLATYNKNLADAKRVILIL